MCYKKLLKPLQITNKYITEYAVKDSVTPSRILYWLSTKDRLGIRIKGSEEAEVAIEKYYVSIKKILFKEIH